MLTDEAKIEITAGRGGDGAVAFDKVKMSLGPTGGRGGNGGNVYFVGVADIFALNRYRSQKKHFAPDGKNGQGNRSDGAAGKDLFLSVPIGTVLKNLNTKESFEIVEVGQKVLIAKGGIGGRGNFYFRSSRNTSPKKREEGKPGEKFDFFLELRLIADAGLIGLPSAGKSSLLNELTAARAKVGAYHFTTLEPNLGVIDKKIIADIPGLIEGASKGKGLGIKFIRHIQRTKILLHCVSLDSDDLVRDWKIVRKELENYSLELSKKKELIVLTKNDLVSKEELAEKIKKIKAKGETIPVSIYDMDSLQKLQKIILQMLA